MKKKNSLILSCATIILCLLFFNRLPNFVYILQSPFLTDAVISDFAGRTILEHLAFGFFFSISVFFLFFGVKKFFNKMSNWGWSFIIGAGATIIASLYWEVLNAKGSIEYLEIGYDLLGILLSFLYVKYLGDFE